MVEPGCNSDDDAHTATSNFSWEPVQREWHATELIKLVLRCVAHCSWDFTYSCNKRFLFLSHPAKNEPCRLFHPNPPSPCFFLIDHNDVPSTQRRRLLVDGGHLDRKLAVPASQDRPSGDPGCRCRVTCGANLTYGPHPRRSDGLIGDPTRELSDKVDVPEEVYTEVEVHPAASTILHAVPRRRSRRFSAGARSI